jgi:tRNA G46 methylase TrmB
VYQFLRGLTWVVRALFGTNHFANLDATTPLDALDVGCGSGVWVLEMCHDYPNCNFTGMDILEAQPRTIVPTNARFVTANVLQRTLSLNSDH